MANFNIFISSDGAKNKDAALQAIQDRSRNDVFKLQILRAAGQAPEGCTISVDKDKLMVSSDDKSAAAKAWADNVKHAVASTRGWDQHSVQTLKALDLPAPSITAQIKNEVVAAKQEQAEAAKPSPFAARRDEAIAKNAQTAAPKLPQPNWAAAARAQIAATREAIAQPQKQQLQQPDLGAGKS